MRVLRPILMSERERQRADGWCSARSFAEAMGISSPVANRLLRQAGRSKASGPLVAPAVLERAARLHYQQLGARVERQQDAALRALHKLTSGPRPGSK